MHIAPCCPYTSQTRRITQYKRRLREPHDNQMIRSSFLRYVALKKEAKLGQRLGWGETNLLRLKNFILIHLIGSQFLRDHLADVLQYLGEGRERSFQGARNMLTNGFNVEGRNVLSTLR